MDSISENTVTGIQNCRLNRHFFRLLLWKITEVLNKDHVHCRGVTLRGFYCSDREGDPWGRTIKNSRVRRDPHLVPYRVIAIAWETTSMPPPTTISMDTSFTTLTARLMWCCVLIPMAYVWVPREVFQNFPKQITCLKLFKTTSDSRYSSQAAVALCELVFGPSFV